MAMHQSDGNLCFVNESYDYDGDYGELGESDDETGNSLKRTSSQARLDEQTSSGGPTRHATKKTKGRVKIKMEFIENKLRRYTTFSKRKTGIMKKAYELSTLTGTQVMLLVASETGHVYTFATKKLQPMITSDSGKSLIQKCLNTPESSEADSQGKSDLSPQSNQHEVTVTTRPPPAHSGNSVTPTKMTSQPPPAHLPFQTSTTAPSTNKTHSVTASEQTSQIIVTGGVIKPVPDSQTPILQTNGAILIGPVSSNSTQANSQDTYVINVPQSVGQSVSTATDVQTVFTSIPKKR
ncbi:DgyrCDS525 [Dimorphilus gyrociliatus]|uniref:DgyrCDS525 n=1 Tax=Dimorphilus gyrociliatus TaxID=2664684 RepID=A0A7I8V7E2_9ANNE|nr:DgyrCDS525 [Dimorphilus gyrociliatus]